MLPFNLYISSPFVVIFDLFALLAKFLWHCFPDLFTLCSAKSIDSLSYYMFVSFAPLKLFLNPFLAPTADSWNTSVSVKFTAIFSAHLFANVFCTHLIMIWFKSTQILFIWICWIHICLVAQFKVVWFGLVYVYTTNIIDMIRHKPTYLFSVSTLYIRMFKRSNEPSNPLKFVSVQ